MTTLTDALSVKIQHAEIDAIHAELAKVVVAMSVASESEFASLYSVLISHTEAHFTEEERMMHDSGFPHLSEHLSEHRQMLQEMKIFQQRKLPISRSYITQRLPERFNLHIIRMDSLLAAWLRSVD